MMRMMRLQWIVTILVLVCVQDFESKPKNSPLQAWASPSKAGSLTVHYFLTAAADLHYAVLPHDANRAPVVDPEMIKKYATEPPPQQRQQLLSSVTANTVVSLVGKKIDLEIANLAAGQSYDIYAVAEVSGSDGVFGKLSSVLNVRTHDVAPAIHDLSLRASDGTTSTLEFEFQTNVTRGQIHYALCRPTQEEHSAFSAYELYQASRNDMHLPHCIVRSQSIETLLLLLAKEHERATERMVIRVDSLEPKTFYELWMVSETHESDGVTSVFMPKMIASTHAEAPELREISLDPENGSTEALTLEIEPIDDSTPFRVYFMMQEQSFMKEDHEDVESLVEKVKETIPETHEEAELVKIQSRENRIFGSITTTSEMPNAWTIKRLEPNVTYDIRFVLETQDSEGVFSHKVYSLSSTTHALAPEIERADVFAPVSQPDRLQLNLTLSSPAIVHYVISESKEALSMENDAFAESSSYSTLNPTNKSNTMEIVLDGLLPHTEYTVHLRIETMDSHGVYGPVTQVSASTHPLAPATKITQVRALDGSTDAIVFHIQVGDAASEASSSSVPETEMVFEWQESSNNRENETQYGSFPCSTTTDMCSHTFSNFSADSEYVFRMYPRTAQAQVCGDWTQYEGQSHIRMKTHASAPAIQDVRVQPQNASTNALVVQVTLDQQSGIIHSGVFKDKTDDIESIFEQCIKTGCDRFHYLNHTMIDLDNATTFIHTGLEPNTSYVLLLHTETMDSQGVLSPQVRRLDPEHQEDHPDSLIMLQTHPEAPEILKMKALPQNASVDSIVLMFELQTCGRVHYFLTNVDYKDPSTMKQPLDHDKSQVFQDLGQVDITTTHVNSTTCTGNLTISGLAPDTTYYTQALSESFHSFGVFAQATYPPADVSMIVTTHAPAPSITSFEIYPTTHVDLGVDVELTRHGVVHYLVFLRQLNMTLTDSSNVSTYFPRETSLELKASRLSGDMFVHASSNESESIFGVGVLHNDSFSVSRDDVSRGLKVHQVWKDQQKKNKNQMIPGSLVDVCVITETADSRGVFGQPECHEVQMPYAFDEIQSSMDELVVKPVVGRADALEIVYTVPTLAGYWNVLSSTTTLDSQNQDQVGTLTGRALEFVVLTDRSTLPGHLDLSTLKRGMKDIAATGALSSIISPRSNSTHISVSQVVEHLDPDTKYSVQILSRSVQGQNPQRALYAHVSPNCSQSTQTFPQAPAMKRYEIYATPGNVSRFSIDFDTTASAGILHARVVQLECNVAKNGRIQEEEDNCLVAEFQQAWNTSSTTKHMVFPEMQEQNPSLLLSPNTSYHITLASESHSGNIRSPWIEPGQDIQTFPNAPVSQVVQVEPRLGSTSELMLSVENHVDPMHLHFVLTKAGTLNASCATPEHIRHSRKMHAAAPKDQDNSTLLYCSDVKIERVHTLDFKPDQALTNFTYAIQHLQPNTAYDVHVVFESWKSRGVLSSGVTTFFNRSTFPLAPLLSGHSAHPTPGRANEIQLHFRLTSPGLVHATVVKARGATTSSARDVMISREPLELVAQETSILRPGQALEHQLNLVIPASEPRRSNFTIHLVTESLGSFGVFGRVASIPNIRVHPEARRFSSVTVKPAKGSSESLSLHTCVDAQEEDTPAGVDTRVYYFVFKSESESKKQLLSQEDAQALAQSQDDDHATLPQWPGLVQWGSELILPEKSDKGQKQDDCIDITIVGNLTENTHYRVYALAESHKSYGVFGPLYTDLPRVKTHSSAPLTPDEIDCSLAPNCAELGRDECWLQENTCGECLIHVMDMRDIGPANTLCRPDDPIVNVDEPDEPIVNTTTHVPESQQGNPCPIHSHQVGPDECQCDTGFTINARGTECVSSLSTEPKSHMSCPVHSSPVSPGQCACDLGYQLNTLESTCVPTIP